VVDSYEVSSEERTRDLPSTFYGLTEYGIYLLEEFDLLEGKPVLQAMYANMEKPEQIQRYEDAPRPSKQSEEELRAELDEVVRDDEVAPTAAARKTTGISNLLNNSGDDVGRATDSDTSTWLEVGSSLRRLLESGDSDDRAAAVSALSEIADASPESVVPVLPTLADTIDDLCLEQQRELSTIFETVASNSPDEISDDVIESLAVFYAQDVDYWQQDMGMARQMLQSGLSVAEHAESDKARISCYTGLGEIALNREKYEVAVDHFNTVLNMDQIDEYDQIKSLICTSIGEIELSRNNIKKASEHFHNSIDISKNRESNATGAALNGLGKVEQERGNLDAAATKYQESLQLLRESDSIRRTAEALSELGRIEQMRGNLDKSTDYLRESIDMLEDSGNINQLAQSFVGLGITEQMRGNLDLSSDILQKSVSLHDQSDNDHGRAQSLHNLGNVEIMRGELDSASEYFQRSESLQNKLGDDTGQARSLSSLGAVNQMKGEMKVALKNYKKSVSLFENNGDRSEMSRVLSNLGSVERMLGDTENAMQHLHQSLEISDEIDDTHGQALTLLSLGELKQAQGNLDSATEYFNRSLELGQEIENPTIIGRATQRLGEVSLRQGKHQTAISQFINSFETFDTVGATQLMINSIDWVTQAFEQAGEDESVVEWCNKGLRIIEETPRQSSDHAEGLRERRAKAQNDTETRVEPLYRAALRAAGHEGEEDAQVTSRFREAWDLRSELDSDSEAYGLALSAGVGLFAEITLLDIEETADSEKTFIDEIEYNRGSLTEAAEALFSVLLQEEPDRPEELTDGPTSVENAESLSDLETSAYKTLFRRLREPDKPIQPPHTLDNHRPNHRRSMFSD
jgi:tetratricopeptide (TPR) repeat protein